MEHPVRIKTTNHCNIRSTVFFLSKTFFFVFPKSQLNFDSTPEISGTQWVSNSVTLFSKLAKHYNMQRTFFEENKICFVFIKVNLVYPMRIEPANNCLPA